MRYVVILHVTIGFVSSFPLVKHAAWDLRRAVELKRSGLNSQLPNCHRRSSVFMNNPSDPFSDYEDLQSRIAEDFDPNEEVPDDVMADLGSSRPSRWMVAKEMLGINIFTYILAGLIVFFLSMNIILGPGWLGGIVGVQGTGTFDDASNSLPDMMDLSSPEFRL